MSEPEIIISNHYTRITKDDIIKKYKNDIHLNAILNIYDKINEKEKKAPYDSENTIGISKFFSNSGLFSIKVVSLDANDDTSISNNEIKSFLEDNIFGKELNTNEEAFKKFLSVFADVELVKITEISDKYNLPIELIRELNMLHINPADIEVLSNDNDERVYKFSYDKDYLLFNNKGLLVEKTEHSETEEYFNDDIFPDSYNIFRYKRNGMDKLYEEENSETGLLIICNLDEYNNETKRIVKTGNIRIEQSFVNGNNMRLDKLQIYDKDNPNIDIEFIYNDDGMFERVNSSTTTVTEENLKSLINVINNGAIVHKDFDIKFENGNIKLIPRICEKVYDEIGNFKYKDINLPAALENMIMNFVQLGYKQDKDFLISKNSNGNITIKYLSPTILRYEYKSKDEIYDDSGRLIEEIFGEKIKPYDAYDASNTPASNLIPKIKRNIINKNNYIETINNIKYEVILDDNMLKIKRNNEDAISIDVGNLDQNFVQNVLMQVSSQALYKIAKEKTVIELTTNLRSNVGGVYVPKSNTLCINSKFNDAIELIRVIGHESGHLFDSVDNVEVATTVIKDLLKNNPSANTEGLSMKELLEKYGTRQFASRIDQEFISTVNKELNKAFPVKNPENASLPLKERIKKEYLVDWPSNSLYALTSTDEFFAEAYNLLTSGNCMSAALLCNYFPESLKLVKERIEREQ